MKIRTVALPAALAGALLLGSGTSSAAVKPQIVDPAGDAKAAQSAYDITGVTFEVTKTVTKTTKVVGGKKRVVTTSTPKDFVVTMALGAAPNVQPGTSYQVVADSPCGTFFLFTYWSALDAGPSTSMQFGECGTAGVDGTALLLDPTVTMAAKSISWKIPFRSLPKQMGLGKSFTDLTAYTAPTEPVVGYGTVDFTGVTPQTADATAIDYATGTSAKLV